MLRFACNLVWLVVFGLWTALAYAALTVFFFLLVVTIPFGLMTFRLAVYALWPFGQALVPREDAGAGTTAGNVLWFVLVGWWLALAHVIAGVALCFTFIGIPLGVGQFKLAVAAVNPFGKEQVTVPRIAFDTQPWPVAYPAVAAPLPVSGAYEPWPVTAPFPTTPYSSLPRGGGGTRPLA